MLPESLEIILALKRRYVGDDSMRKVEFNKGKNK